MLIVRSKDTQSNFDSSISMRLQHTIMFLVRSKDAQSDANSNISMKLQQHSKPHSNKLVSIKS